MLWVPILYHALYGFVVMAGADLGTSTRFAYRNGLLYTLQRISGVVAFVFIAWHVYSIAAVLLFPCTSRSITRSCTDSQESGVVRLLRPRGAGGALPFCNGIFTFCITWGLTVSERSQALVQRLSLGLFFVLAPVAVCILAAFR